MSKKKKWTPPSVQRTILIGCEGEGERVFLSYLKKLYYPRGQGFDVTPRNMWGGSPITTVIRTRSEGHDQKYAWIDTDRTEIEEARVLAEKSGITLFENIPCFEKEILKMLGKTKNAKDYKKEFKKYFPEEDLCDEKAYEKLFPKKKIDELREMNSFIFENIVRLLETGNI